MPPVCTEASLPSEGVGTERLRQEKRALDAVDSKKRVLPDFVENACATQAACERVVDAYRDGQVGLHVRVCVGRPDGEPQEYVAVFEALMVDDLDVVLRERNAVDKHTVKVIHGRDGDRVNDAMAELPVQFVQHPEALIPSVVRLYAFDGVPVLLGKLLYAVLGFEPLAVSENWELDGHRVEFAFQGWVLPDREQRELVRRVVERGAGVTEERSEQPRQLPSLDGLGLWIDGAMEGGFPPVTVYLRNPNVVRARFPEPFAQRIEASPSRFAHFRRCQVSAKRSLQPSFPTAVD